MRCEFHSVSVARKPGAARKRSYSSGSDDTGMSTACVRSAVAIVFMSGRIDSSMRASFGRPLK